jgi:1,4-dihydroxy-6-naphthoate synthase
MDNRHFVRYDSIIPMLQRGEADAGVVIHEDRFVYPQKGLVKVADLGQWWEQETGAPIPLGCIAMKHTLAETFADRFDALVRKSIAAAHSHPTEALPFIRSLAQQMDGGVLDKHIAAFVNDYSLDLGDDGDRAVAVLNAKARHAGLIP